MKKTRVAKYLFKLESGVYQTEMHEEDGVKRRRSHPSKKAAELHIARVLNGRYEVKVNGGRKTPIRYKLLDAINDFERSKVQLHRRPATLKRYRPIFEQLRIFVQQNGIEYVDEFTPDDATKLFNVLTQPRRDPKGSTDRTLIAAPKTINLFLQTVKGLFKEEIAKRHITANPLAHLSNLPLERKRPEYFTREELHAFFAVDMDVAYRRAFMGLLLTGMRFAELANIHFEDVNLESGHIEVRSRGDFKTKTHNAERKIPMGADLLELLETIFSEPLSDTYVFATPHGHQLRERSLLQVCKRTGNRAGLTCRLFLHKFRHTYATFLVQAGVPLAHIKALLGHHSITMTEIYAHTSSDHLHPEVRHLDGLVPGKKGQLG